MTSMLIKTIEKNFLVNTELFFVKKGPLTIEATIDISVNNSLGRKHDTN